MTDDFRPVTITTLFNNGITIISRQCERSGIMSYWIDDNGQRRLASRIEILRIVHDESWQDYA